MNSTKPPEGDFHNFGRRVFCQPTLGRVVKPRPTLWEHLVLDSKSPLRVLLSGPRWTALPSLNVPISIAFEETHVSYLEALRWIPERISESDIERAGAVLVLILALGISDLHLDNVAIGYNSFDEFIFTPIDIECLFERYLTLRGTHLIASSQVTQDRAGLSFLLPVLTSKSNFFSAFFGGMLDAMLELEEREKELALILSPYFRDGCPIRVILRSTSIYRDFFNQGGSVVFSPPELIQLKRQDIPYFFRKPDRQELYWLEKSSEGNLLPIGVIAEDLRRSGLSEFSFITKVEECFADQYLRKKVLASIAQLVREAKTPESSFRYGESSIFISNTTVICSNRSEVLGEVRI